MLCSLRRIVPFVFQIALAERGATGLELAGMRLVSQMSTSGDPQDNVGAARAAQLAAEQLARDVAVRHGFRVQDFSLAWDGGNFDACRSEHELLITSRDGRQAAARIDHAALLLGDPWKYVRELDAAFAKLRRRSRARGI